MGVNLIKDWLQLFLLKYFIQKYIDTFHSSTPPNLTLPVIDAKLYIDSVCAKYLSFINEIYLKSSLISLIICCLKVIIIKAIFIDIYCYHLSRVEYTVL